MKKCVDVLREWVQNVSMPKELSREDIAATVVYELYLVNLLEAQGVTYRGESIRYRAPLSLLVVKVTIDGAPYVSFINGRTPTECKLIFLSRLQEKSLEWRVDKFA